MFADREEAARLLADTLQEYKGQNPLVLAIPRGAVPMAKIIAKALQGELDVVLVRKLGAPGNPEYAIGSVDESGNVRMTDPGSATPEYIEKEKEEQLEKIRQRRRMYTPVRPPIDPAGRIVIIVDDGIATGATMVAALESVRQKNPAKLICAVPVGSPDSVASVREHADDVICLQTPGLFMAVGQFYKYFAQVEDEDVVEMLRAS